VSRRVRPSVLEIDLAQALWCLGQLPPEDIPEIACQALERGFDSPTIRKLAGLHKPVASDIGDLFDRAMIEMGRKPLSKKAAGLLIAKDIAAQIVRGQIDPYQGAREIWWEIWNECERPEELKAFVGLADGYEDEPSHREQYRNDIVAEAKKLLDL
jgi:hypothetical protein